ncbi:hypothetical protein [Nonomuraea zeae]|uniref:Uncharacterized protein n=1 Tax=Nonomuraea zeae TaxID=1642303 RepID=A0A5S4GEW0_9ACTN|nr:hypothetical protein [Nonomuraea zeae]TMR31526.1 hypothetical protein ETD85_25560 [Nonomuraea zeae]
MRTITLPNTLASQDGRCSAKPEVIYTARWFCRDTSDGPASVAIARAAVDILHNQPELLGSVRARSRTRSAPVGRSSPRLTARAKVSSDDLAVIRHALTAVAEVKVSA